MSELKAGVGLSRKWDAREAGREVAETALEKLDGEKPKFFLLFSTIHYEKYGGFQELLNGVWEVLPEGTPLIGGTVAGFMMSEGVYSRGTAGVVFGGSFTVQGAFSRGTRRNPNRVAREVSNQLSGEHLVLTFLPGPSMPNIKSGEKLIVTKSKTVAKVAPKLLEFSTTRLNKGVGREMEVLETLSVNLPSSCIAGSSTIDDNKYNDNFQFFNRNFYSDALAVIGVNYPNFHVYTIETMPMPTRWYRVTQKKAFDHIVEKIEGKPALSVYLNELGYSEDMIFDEPHLVHRRFVFAPIVTRDKYGGYHPRCPGTFYGKSMGFGHPIFDEVGFSYTNGEYVSDTFKSFFEKFNDERTVLLLSFSCAVLYEALGKGIYKIYSDIREWFDKDYLLIFGGGEILSEREKQKGPKILEMSLTGVGLY